MKKVILFLLAVIVASAIAESHVGVAKIVGGANDINVTGWVHFVTINSVTVRVIVHISGISNNPDSTHGIHVHQYGDITEQVNITSTGGHYALPGQTHGCEPTATRHLGDMGNWNATAGVINQYKELDLLALTGGTSIIGKAVVLHITTDDCAGNVGGARLAYGVIGIANPAYLPAEVLALIPDTNNTAISEDISVLRAVAVITPTNPATGSVRGVVLFEQSVLGVSIRARISGLPSNTSAYGFHIHIFGDLNSTDGLSASSHFNPFNSAHGLPPNATRHAGDLGNICTYVATDAFYNYTFTDLLTLNFTNNIIGRNVIVHAIRDDGGTNYGARLAHGVIGVASPTTTVTFPVDLAAIRSPACETFAATTTTTTAAATTTTTTTTTTSTSTTGSPATSTTGNSPSSSASTVASFLGFVVLGLFVALGF